MITVKDLSPAEREIYESIIKFFPTTNKESALDYAVQGGVRLQFIYT